MSNIRIRKEPVKPERQTTTLDLSWIVSIEDGKSLQYYIELINHQIKKLIDEETNSYQSYGNYLRVTDGELYFVDAARDYTYLLPRKVTASDIYCEYDSYESRLAFTLKLVENDESYANSVAQYEDKHREWKAWYDENEAEIVAELKRREDAKNEKIEQRRTARIKRLKREKAKLESQLKEIS